MTKKIEITAGMPIETRGSISEHPIYAFVSLAPSDIHNPTAMRLIRELNLNGLRAWVPFHDILPGSGLKDLEEKLRSSEFYVVVLSRKMMERNSVGIKWEFSLASTWFFLSGRPKIFLVAVDNTPTPEFLEHLQRYDLTEDFSSELSRLLAEMKRAVQKPLVTFPIEEMHDGSSLLHIASAVDQNLLRSYSRNPDELRTIDRRLFEELVAELFHGFGYDVELTKQTRDGGIDIVAIKHAEVGVKYLIECKRPDPGNKVTVAPVRKLLGVFHDIPVTKAILATTSYFTRDARLLSERHEWELELRDFNGVMAWIKTYLKSRTGNR